MSKEILDRPNPQGWSREEQYDRLDKSYMGCLVLTFVSWYVIQTYYMGAYVSFLENGGFNSEGIVNLAQCGTIYLGPCLMLSIFVILKQVPIFRKFVSYTSLIIAIVMYPASAIVLLLPSFAFAWILNFVAIFSDNILLSLNFTVIAIMVFRLLHSFARMQIDYEFAALAKANQK